MSSVTRESLHPARNPTQEPKLKPASSSGAPGYSRREKIERGQNVVLLADAPCRACLRSSPLREN